MPHDALCLSIPAVTDTLAALRAATLSLADLPLGTLAHVLSVRPGQHEHERELTQRLLEIGFIEGEPVRVIAHGHPGREPIAVRVGGTTFALRRFEAERVLVAATTREARPQETSPELAALAPPEGARPRLGAALRH